MKASPKVLFFVGVGSLILIGIYSRLPNYRNLVVSQYQSSENITETAPSKETKVILYWTPMFRVVDFYLGLGNKIFENCTYKNCYTTYDKDYRPVENFDAIIFHGVEYTERKFGKPQRRDPKQVYIFSNQESPLNTPAFIENYNNFYNWTMTYRLDSDVLRPYGFLVRRKANYQPPSIEEIRRRPKKLAWFVSNCGTDSKRELLYNAIRKHVQVDVYGSCGDLKCPRTSSDECYDMIEKNYKFYLSFENSICDDYVTEKLYNVLQRNIIPVVYGGANYSIVAPPNSVINVMNFDSDVDLIDYIRYLDTHPEEYLKYFEWKKDYVSNTSNDLVLCSLCEKLHKPIESKVYSDIAGWWRGAKSDKCSREFINKFL